jgi:hypothetical protein
MKEEKSLLPCPFCGEIPVYIENESGIVVKCMNTDCSVYTYTEGKASKAIARKSWNTRIPIVQQPLCGSATLHQNQPTADFA